MKGRSSQYVTTYRPGETITVRLNETINHPSHYRISFNPNGDTFEDPDAVDDKTGKHPYVLLDNIADQNAAQQSVEVTLPSVACDNCTLQLIQVMYDKGGNGFAGNDGVGRRGDDLYYSCADIVLKGEPVGGKPLAPPDASTTADAGGASALVFADTTGLHDGGVGHDAGIDREAESGEDDGCSLGSRQGDASGSWLLMGFVALVARARRRRA